MHRLHSSLYYCTFLLFFVGDEEVLSENSTLTTSRDRYLANHVFVELDTFSSVDCGRECEKISDCQSFNYWRRENRCELNASTREAHPSDYVISYGVWYISAEAYRDNTQSCQSGGGCPDGACFNGGACAADCSSNGFICHCSMEYTGSRCEEAVYGCLGPPSVYNVNVDNAITSQPCNTLTDPDGMMAAMKDFQDTDVCGACLELTGPTGTAVVKVLSDCPGCTTSEDMMVTEDVKAIIANDTSGSFSVTSLPVACPDVGFIKMKMMDPCMFGFYGLVTYDTLHPIASLEILKNSQWYNLLRGTSGLYSNFFTVPAAASPITLPTDVRIHSTTNQTVTYRLMDCQDNTVYDTNLQFTQC
ncbi:uncharacterized protein [Ptychodera flava]|uniref:uncharacterized protein n=1 Tax=Ptychodera flava TaxID=63121 RepID=UPI003969EB8F